MADRMRANSDDEGPEYYDGIDSPAGDPPSCLCNEACSCDADAMALFDAWQWNNDNESLLPGGSGAVEKTGDTYAITVAWVEGRVETAEGSETFVFEFQP
jgi:hypothetical protein